MKLFTTATLIATACAGLVAAAPASAEQATATAAGAAMAAASSQQKAKAQPDKAKYCMKVEATTGSRIAQRECRSKAEWEALGLDTASFR